MTCLHCAARGVACTQDSCPRAPKGVPYDPASMCRPCWLRVNPGFVATGVGPSLRRRLELASACVHRGAPTGREVPCDECGAAHLALPVLACALHGECTERVAQRSAGVASCKTCPDRKAPEVITVNQSACGIGDALSGSLAINGFRLREEAARTGKRVVYRVSPQSIPFVGLFDLGGVTLAHHVWDGGNTTANRPPGAPLTDLQLNPWYGDEVSTLGEYTRVMRNCRNLGGVTPVVPRLKDRGGLLAGGRDYAGCVVVVPFCAWRNREWSLANWLNLERRLREHGYRVVVLDWPTGENRTAPLRSEKLIGAPADRVAGVLLNAACVVSNDTGMAHLASVMGVSSLVLCGEIPGRAIWPAYGDSVRWIDSIGNMGGIGVDQVLGQALDIAGPPRRPEGATGETIKAHARRVREGWYQEHCRAPLLDVGCWVDYLLPGFPCTRWDQMYGDGDATFLAGVPDSSYQTIYASHVLEHVNDPVTALKNWYRVLAPGGKLLVSVPHALLYEGQDHLPSRWNPDHKTFWLPGGRGIREKPAHWRGLKRTILDAIPDAEILSLRVCDEGHHYPDKSVHPLGEFSIEAVVRKPA